MAWRSAVRAKLLSDGQALPLAADTGEIDGGAEALGPADLIQQQCPVNVRTSPDVHYPIMGAQIGAVVLRLRFDESGRVTEHRVLSHAGNEEFADAVSHVAGRWRVTRGRQAQPNCRMSGVLLLPISFVFHG